MAWTITSANYQIGNLQYINWSGVADASDLTDQVVVDVSALLPIAPTQLTIDYLRIATGAGVSAVLEWDATTDGLILNCPGGCTLELPINGDRADQQAAGWTKDPIATGTTGDMLLTTIGGGLGEGVSIQARLLLRP